MARVALFLGVIAAVVAANAFHARMMAIVNVGLPKIDRIDPVPSYPLKALRVWQEYRRQYPAGRLLYAYWSALAIATLLFALFVWLSNR